MGSDVSHFNVSLIVQGKVTRQCPSITIFEDKGEPKRGVEPAPFPLTSRAPYHQAKPAHSHTDSASSILNSFKVERRKKVGQEQTDDSAYE